MMLENAITMDYHVAKQKNDIVELMALRYGHNIMSTNFWFQNEIDCLV